VRAVRTSSRFRITRARLGSGHWTLLSYVAARIETVHLSGDVWSLPLRPPGVLAPSANSCP
jgi:hypothetical protein